MCIYTYMHIYMHTYDVYIYTHMSLFCDVVSSLQLMCRPLRYFSSAYWDTSWPSRNGNGDSKVRLEVLLRCLDLNPRSFRAPWARVWLWRWSESGVALPGTVSRGCEPWGPMCRGGLDHVSAPWGCSPRRAGLSRFNHEGPLGARSRD